MIAISLSVELDVDQIKRRASTLCLDWYSESAFVGGSGKKNGLPQNAFQEVSPEVAVLRTMPRRYTAATYRRHHTGCGTKRPTHRVANGIWSQLAREASHSLARVRLVVAFTPNLSTADTPWQGTCGQRAKCSQRHISTAVNEYILHSRRTTFQ